MKYKALFLDLDGTTVTMGNTIVSRRVTQAILNADKEIRVCLATGRILHQVVPIVETLKLSGLCVIANGIQIYDPKMKRVINQIKIKTEDVPFVVGILEKYNLAVRYFDGKSDTLFQENVPHNEVLSLYVESVDKKIAEKITHDLSFMPEVVTHQMIVHSDPNLVGLEVCHVSATKQHGIQEVAKRLNISTHEIIGIGDGYNDFPLLMACGMKVAMGNAVPELKAIADFIAPTVEDDGVATVIEKFILED